MKKLILYTSLFLVLTAIVYFFMALVLFKVQLGGTPFLYRATHGLQWKGGPAYHVFKDFDITKKRDIIVLGTSHAYRGYNPEIFKEYGLELRGLATSSQSLKSSYVISKSLISNANCKLVIIDLYDRIFTLSSLESTADLIQHLPDHHSALRMAWESRDIRAVNMFTTRLISANSDLLFDSKVPMKNGFGTSYDTISFPIKKRYYPYVYKTNDEQFKYLKKLIRHLKENGIEVILAQCPFPYFVNKTNHLKFVEDLKPILEEFDVPYLDYSYHPELTEITLFYDDNHLNHSGVKLYNRKLINDLIKLGYLNASKSDLSSD